MTADNTLSNQGTVHAIVESDGKQFVVQRVNGEITKTWEATDRSAEILAASTVLKDPNLGK